MSDTILVTGGAGFIGSAFVRYLIRETDVRVVNVDRLTYASSPEAVAEVSSSSRYRFERLDVCDTEKILALLREVRPVAVSHLAAESHVDRSIDGPAEFLRTNILGTFSILEATLEYWRALPPDQTERFRLHHISTDEVFGSLEQHDPGFAEEDAYAPNSPYAASKAGADHLVRAWHHTYGLPVLLTNCSNNYGPFQFPEKLVPHMILRAIHGMELPLYGDGRQVRDWLHVEDHVRALHRVLREGRPGRSYNIGGRSERENLEVVRQICDVLNEGCPLEDGTSYRDRIRFVKDRPGHDRRYAVDSSRIERELGWRARMNFEEGLRQTVAWYLENEWWWQPLWNRRYSGERLGTRT